MISRRVFDNRQPKTCNSFRLALGPCRFFKPLSCSSALFMCALTCLFFRGTWLGWSRNAGIHSLLWGLHFLRLLWGWTRLLQTVQSRVGGKTRSSFPGRPQFSSYISYEGDISTSYVALLTCLYEIERLDSWSFFISLQNSTVKLCFPHPPFRVGNKLETHTMQLKEEKLRLCRWKWGWRTETL